jgi:large subunit ribosomal protein L15
MQIHELKVKSTKDRKRVGRGGKKGTYSGAGMKGQRSRSGFSQRATFGGGGARFVMSSKKNRGFKSTKPDNQPVNLERIEAKFAADQEVNPETLKKAGIISKTELPVKILSRGELSKKLTFKEVLVSEAAKEKIEKAGGKID